MRALLVIVGWIAASCVRPESVECADGSVCPRDRMCRLIAETYQCVSDEQIAACDGKSDFEACAGGTCLGGVCIAPSCGDGRIGPIEVCDDGNTTSGDGCSPDCRSNERCGNGVIDQQVGEQCDDGPERGGLSYDGCSSTCVDEQPQWRVLLDYDELTSNPGLFQIEYGADRGRVIVIASAKNQVRAFELEAGVWMDVSSAVSPVERSDFRIAYDSRRRRLVMFGGLGFLDTWEWDGTTWTLAQPATVPPARSAHVMTYDPIGRRVVMFGGRSNLFGTGSELGDTWVWDGTEWSEIVGPGPSRRADAAMAFDPVRGELVLHGGASDTGDLLDDTWVLAGTTWTQRTPAVTAGPRRQHTMAFDPLSKRVLAHGGRDTVGPLSTTFAWDGTTWTQVAGQQPDMLRGKLVSSTHEQRVLFLSQGGIYEWNGAGWSQRVAIVQGGVHRPFAAAAVDPVHRRMLVFGGQLAAGDSASTEIWNGMWTQHVGVTPTARSLAAMAYDAVRDEFVLFGGQNASSSDETWVWNGTWQQRATSPAPPRRAGHTLVFDAKRGVVVLFGGARDGEILGDTWTWNGTTWTEVAGSGPPARRFHTAAYDPIREEIVMFGGGRGLGETPLGDTWTWNGAWQMQTALGPPARFLTGLAWDPARARLVLFGGNNGVSDFNDVWEWDGMAWGQVAVPAVAARSGHALVTSVDGTGVVQFGTAGPPTRSEVQQLRWATEKVAREVCVLGEDFDRDGHELASCGGGDPDCWRICAPTCPPGTSCPAGAVGCGDGVCTAGRESCRSCAADCGACPPTCGDLACNGSETNATCAADCP